MRGAILPGFVKFPPEGAIIGRLLAGYADLEIGLMHCVAVVCDDFDAALKDMFRQRGESRRINVAEAAGRPHYAAIGLRPDFSTAVDALRHCLKARNMYAHCNWYDDRSGQLAFVNVEELAKEKRPVRDLRSLKVHHVDVALLQEIERFFVHTDALLAYANYESRLKRGKIKHRVFAKPTLMAYPSLFL